MFSFIFAFVWFSVSSGFSVFSLIFLSYVSLFYFTIYRTLCFSFSFLSVFSSNSVLRHLYSLCVKYTHVSRATLDDFFREVNIFQNINEHFFNTANIFGTTWIYFYV